MILNGSWNRFVGPNDADEYPVITSIAKIAYILPISDWFSEGAGSAIEQMKTNKKVHWKFMPVMH